MTFARITTHFTKLNIESMLGLNSFHFEYEQGHITIIYIIKELVHVNG